MPETFHIAIRRVPPSGNELRRRFRHPMVYKQLRDNWQQELHFAVGQRDRGRMAGLAHNHPIVGVQVEVSKPRQYDEDNLIAGIKPILDSLVRLGWLQDDSPKHLKLSVKQVKSKNKGTYLTLTYA